VPPVPTVPAELAARVAAGETRAVARLISYLEDGDPLAALTVRAFSAETRARAAGAHLVGITGPPGSGKSTLTDKLVAGLRARGARVGVLAVDPSSPFTGGAILGDRLRMQGHATDGGVFIRSLASRGRLGGLSRATAAAARVLASAGYDWVLIETVGVGQSEVDVVKIADTVVLVSVPGLGDDIQAIKAGIMEIGDVFVVNKSDREGADRVVREIRAMLETAAALAQGRPAAPVVDTLAAHHGAAPAAVGAAASAVTGLADANGHPALPPVLKTCAETGEGVGELLAAVLAHRERMAVTGGLEARRLEGARVELRSLIAFRLLDALEGREGRALEDRLAKAVLSHECDAYEAAEELFAALAKGGIS
jgi:LAO/AO transport system kinase